MLLETSGREKRWLEENRAALDTYNWAVAQHGLLSDETGLHEESSVITSPPPKYSMGGGAAP
jgi:hypothetical protein